MTGFGEEISGAYTDHTGTDDSYLHKNLSQQNVNWKSETGGQPFMTGHLLMYFRSLLVSAGKCRTLVKVSQNQTVMLPRRTSDKPVQ